MSVSDCPFWTLLAVLKLLLWRHEGCQEGIWKLRNRVRHLLFLKIKVRVFVRMYLYKLQRRVNLHACLQPKPGSGNTNNSYTHSYTRLHAWIEPSSRPQARTRTCNNTNHRNVDGSPSPPGMQTCCQMLMVLPAPQGCKRVAGNAFLRCDDVQQLSPMVN